MFQMPWWGGGAHQVPGTPWGSEKPLFPCLWSGSLALKGKLVPGTWVNRLTSDYQAGPHPSAGGLAWGAIDGGWRPGLERAPFFF